MSNIKDFLIARANDLRKDSHCQSRIVADSLISLKFKDGHIHHLLPGAVPVEEFINSLLAHESKPALRSPLPKESVNKRPIILKNRQAIGDILMMTCAIRDLKISFPDWPINISTTAMHIWDNNPYLDRSLASDNAEVIEIGPGFLTNASNRDDRHFANAFRISIEEKLGISIQQGPIRPDIWMTEEECSTPIIEPPYWIIVAGEKGDWTAKTYPFLRWQSLVKKLSHIKFVQIGAKEHKHPNLEGDNVINLIGKTQDKHTGIRDLFRLFYFAEGSMGLVSFQMHLAAAFGMPCLVIAGAREPARFTRYPGHQYLCTDGCLPCASASACWHCDLEKTCKFICTDESEQKFPKCVDIISEEDVLRAFYQYYDGGRLSLDHSRVPFMFNKTTKNTEKPISIKMTPIKTSDSPPIKKEEQFFEKLGFKWNGTAITEKDWTFLLKVIKDHNIKTVLEFGSGLSTVLLHSTGVDVISYESSQNWIKSLIERGISNFVTIRKWDGKEIKEELGKFDLAIVDGPAGGQTREFSTKIASEHSDLVLVHDANREWERKWQDKYLKNKFDGPGKGGNRWHFWKKKEIPFTEFQEKMKEVARIEEIPPGELSIADLNKPLLRVLFNGRGEGGAEKSTTWIMNRFIEKGWRVEYVYPGKAPSGTFRKHGNAEITAIGSLEALKQPCDVLLLYTNDWVWTFNDDDVRTAMEASVAKRKVMAVNFRLGGIGTIPWTQGWNRYLFLNTSLENSFRTAYMKSKTFSETYSLSTRSLPPPTDLSEYLKAEPNYEGEMRIVRHSSQGNAKYSPDFNEKVEAILERFPNAIIRLMPAPSFINDFGERVISHQRNNPQVSEFLAMGNIFWYDLPDGYHDQGPKVVMEAQASGLPVIANNHSGPKDRVIEGTGFLYDDFEDSLEMFEKLNNPFTRKLMGEAARDHAKKEYNPNLWIDEIIGEKDKDE